MWRPWGDLSQICTAICTTTKPHLTGEWAHRVSMIWVLSKALDHADRCSPTDTRHGQQAGWHRNSYTAVKENWQLWPCWLGSNTCKHPHVSRCSRAPVFSVCSLSLYIIFRQQGKKHPLSFHVVDLETHHVILYLILYSSNTNTYTV